MAERLVIKIGSNVLTRADGTLDVTRMSALVDQIVRLRGLGYEIIVVSSGAVACGRSLVRKHGKLDSVEQRQLYSAVGQVRLINLYYSLFRDYGISIGQVLTMKESFATRKEYLNQRSCMEVMLANGVIPIVNENDTVSVTELMFTDNDELSGLVASMMDAQNLVILSNIDGIYDGDPADPASKVIRRVEPDDDLSGYIRTGKSSFGRGGMLTKTSIAQKVALEGIRVIIANGNKDNILADLAACLGGRENLTPALTPVFTEFVPAAPQRAEGHHRQRRRQLAAGGSNRRRGRIRGGRHHSHPGRKGPRRGARQVFILQRGGGRKPRQTRPQATGAL